MPALDLWPLLEKLEIRTKKGKRIKLDRHSPFAWAQREFVAEVERQYNLGLPVRIIVLKGRQLGISTVTEAILFLWCFIHPGAFSLVLSKEKDDSTYLFSMTKRYWTHGPFKDLFELKYDTKEEMEWDSPLESRVRVATAKKEEVGRGMTIQACHCSEVAFWGDNVDTIIPGLENAIPPEHGTIWIHESTASGVGGYFHDEWMDATDPEGGKSDFVPMFFPWFWHDEYEIIDHHLTFDDLEREGEFGDEHGVLRFLLAEGVDESRVMAKMAWRRRKIRNAPKGLDGFHEEYPCTPEEAFLSTGSNVFPLEKLMECYKRHVGVSRGYLYNNRGQIGFHETDQGHWLIYKTPGKRQKYVVACDPTKTIEGDPACIQVLNRATMEQVAVWHGSAVASQVGEIALAAAYWYNNALINTEVQGGGRDVMQVWRDAGYGNIWLDRRPDKSRRSNQVLGWNTTYDTKQWLITTVQGFLQRKDVVIHHPATYYELSQYTALEDGTFGPARRSGHDDCVMAYGIAIMTASTEWSTLGLEEIMGQGRGDPDLGAHRIVIENAGRAAEVPGMGNPRREESLYALAGEIEEWY
jgi:Terminase RNaseH-like domain